jgi:hypothetical protein
MSYTFGDQQDKLSSLLGDSNTSTEDMFPAAQRNKEINRGELNLAVDAKDLIAYATGTVSGASITLPTDYVDVHMLIVNGYILTNDREISLEDYEIYVTNGGNGGDTAYYYWTDVSGNELINLVGSSADGQTYKLYYFKKPTTELSATTDTSLHREEFREASVYYAASELMKQIGKAQQANDFRVVYEAFVQKADAWARSRYIKKNQARPDIGISSLNSTDIQGRSYIG